ncbi:hypothetical protein KIV56_17330 [Cryobacterium breve]|uniref:Uncharacterized protein n=1 Tax=Cryobacterium breve TaxID=1259258 RepID=A0ABY7NBM0_9MICO|nr:hypothetical protein [Cryobacterium breve]WBM79905.1 hypothetical protein KIV56_17330 [Cryobacterium breve]
MSGIVRSSHRNYDEKYLFITRRSPHGSYTWRDEPNPTRNQEGWAFLPRPEQAEGQECKAKKGARCSQEGKEEISAASDPTNFQI